MQTKVDITRILSGDARCISIENEGEEDGIWLDLLDGWRSDHGTCQCHEWTMEDLHQAFQRITWDPDQFAQQNGGRRPPESNRVAHINGGAK